jgi:hypothetical protein
MSLENGRLDTALLKMLGDPQGCVEDDEESESKFMSGFLDPEERTR